MLYLGFMVWYAVFCIQCLTVCACGTAMMMMMIVLFMWTSASVASSYSVVVYYGLAALALVDCTLLLIALL